MRKIVLLLLCLFLFLFPTPYSLNPTFAQNCSSSYSNRVQNGLISSPQIQSGSKIGGTSGACIIDPKAAFAPYKVPTYEDLKSLYYTQSKASTTDATPTSGTANQGTLRSALNSYDIVLIRGDLELNGALGGTAKTAVIFVEGNLRFGNNFTFGDNNNGVAFVVKGNVNIDQNVTQIDAVLISEGVNNYSICTAYNGTSCPTTNINTSQLFIYGSLISLNESAPIKFRRSFNNNQQPAEIINHQVKYLVILRNLLSDTFQRWSEIQ